MRLRSSRGREVTVVVGGEGADELFCGYPRYAWLSRADRLHRIVPAPVLAAVRGGAAALGDSKRARRLRDVLTAQSAAVRSASWVSAGRVDARRRLYGPRLAPFAATLHRIAGPAASGDAKGSAVVAAMLRDQGVWLPDDVLMKADRASMQVSLEPRTPYLDRDLVDFAATVPTEVHRRGGGKFLLRETLARLLPREIARRRKVAFRTPTADWLRGPLRPLVQHHVLEGALTGDGWFDLAALSRIADRHWSREADGTAVLWPALVLGVWLDTLPAAVRRAGARGGPVMPGSGG